MTTDIENGIKAQLNGLAEFEAQRDQIDYNKAKLLDEVKIPAEVEAIIKVSMERIAAVDAAYEPQFVKNRETTQAALKHIVIPEEIKAALAEIDRQRSLVVTENEKETLRIRELIRREKFDLQKEMERNTRQVYEDIAKRKADIEAEFAGSRQAVEENIDRLKELIKANVKQVRQSVRGDFYHAVYVNGRITWNTDKMEAWMHDHPFLAEARKEGEPSVTIRKI